MREDLTKMNFEQIESLINNYEARIANLHKEYCELIGTKSNWIALLEERLANVHKGYQDHGRKQDEIIKQLEDKVAKFKNNLYLYENHRTDAYLEKQVNYYRRAWEAAKKEVDFYISANKQLQAETELKGEGCNKYKLAVEAAKKELNDAKAQVERLQYAVDIRKEDIKKFQAVAAKFAEENETLKAKAELNSGSYLELAKENESLKKQLAYETTAKQHCVANAKERVEKLEREIVVYEKAIREHAVEKEDLRNSYRLQDEYIFKLRKIIKRYAGCRVCIHWDKPEDECQQACLEACACEKPNWQLNVEVL